MLLQHSQQNENLGRIWWAISTMCHMCLAKGVCLVVSKKHAAFPAHCWTGRCGPRVSHEKISKQAFHAKEKYMQHLRAPHTCDMYINVFAPRLSWLQRWLAVCWLQHLRRQADICLTQEANYIIAACHICHYERLCQWKLNKANISAHLCWVAGKAHGGILSTTFAVLSTVAPTQAILHRSFGTFLKLQHFKIFQAFVWFETVPVLTSTSMIYLIIFVYRYIHTHTFWYFSLMAGFILLDSPAGLLPFAVCALLPHSNQIHLVGFCFCVLLLPCHP